jgi:hypothetical protein
MVLGTVLETVYSNSDTNLHCSSLDGVAGTGITFLHLIILHTIRGKEVNVKLFCRHVLQEIC